MVKGGDAEETTGSLRLSKWMRARRGKPPSTLCGLPFLGEGRVGAECCFHKKKEHKNLLAASAVCGSSSHFSSSACAAGRKCFRTSSGTLAASSTAVIAAVSMIAFGCGASSISFVPWA